MADAVPRKVIPSEAIEARITRRSLWTWLRGKTEEEKNNRLKCPYQDSNLGRRGIALPQHDDLTTNLYGPEVLLLIPARIRLRGTQLQVDCQRKESKKVH